MPVIAFTFRRFSCDFKCISWVTLDKIEFLYINVLLVGDPGHGSGETTFKKLNTRDNKNLLGWEWSLQNPAMTKS